MRILTPIKQVPDPFAKVKPLPDGTGLDDSGIKLEVNPFDEIAVEEAVRLRDRHGDVEIIAVSIGDASAEDQLRKVLAMGADRAILVESGDPWDSPAVAKELAVIALEVQPDLILMGKQATDDDNNQVGQMLAAKLRWPQATFASHVVVSGANVLVTRETDAGEETLEMPMPAVITADLRLNEPRYIALPGIIKARSKPLDRRAPSSPPVLKSKVVRMEPAAARPPGRKVASVDELISALRDRGVI